MVRCGLFLLTWIRPDLSFRLWQLMGDWWCCFSTVSGEVRHLREGLSLTHSDLALTCGGQQKFVSVIIRLPDCCLKNICVSFPLLAISKPVLHFQIQAAFQNCILFLVFSIECYCFLVRKDIKFIQETKKNLRMKCAWLGTHKWQKWEQGGFIKSPWQSRQIDII